MLPVCCVPSHKVERQMCSCFTEPGAQAGARKGIHPLHNLQTQIFCSTVLQPHGVAIYPQRTSHKPCRREFCHAPVKTFSVLTVSSCLSAGMYPMVPCSSAYLLIPSYIFSQLCFYSSSFLLLPCLLQSNLTMHAQ